MGKQGLVLTFTQNMLDAKITDYHWMVNAIKEIRAVGAKTTQYGIEAILSKVVGSVGDH